MPEFAIFLRAVNVGGTGRLIMSELSSACRNVGFSKAATYLASGNLLISSVWDEHAVRERIDTALTSITARPPRFVIRTAPELADILARNPFGDALGSKVLVTFLDADLTSEATASISGRVDEQVRLATREAYVFYPRGISVSKLRIRALDFGTTRNLNTVRAVHDRLTALKTA